MKMNLSVPLAFVLAFTPGIALAMNGDGPGSSQQAQSPPLETSHAILPTSIESAVVAQAKTTEQSQVSPRDQFQKCNRVIEQTRDQARQLAGFASSTSFNVDKTIRQHEQLKESLGSLKLEHERFYKGLTPEQQNSVQMRNTNLSQAQDRLQNLVKEMERELTDSTLHAKEVAEQARVTQREMKSYQKEFRAMGKDLGLPSY